MIVHVVNGDSVADSLRSADPELAVVITRDAACAGPAPAAFGDDWITTRAGYLADAYDDDRWRFADGRVISRAA